MSETYTVEERERALDQWTTAIATAHSGADVLDDALLAGQELQCLANRLSAENERLRGRVEEARELLEESSYNGGMASSEERAEYFTRKREWLSVSDSQGVDDAHAK